MRLNKNSMFLIAWAIMVLCTLIVQGSEFKYMLPTGLMKCSCSIVALMFLACKIFVFSKYTKGQLVFIFLTMGIVLMVSYQSLSISLLLYITFIFAASGVEFRKLVETDIKIRVMLLLFLFVCSSLGIISSYSRLINGTVKMAFGWSHPNSFCGNAIIVLLEWVYLEWKGLSWKHATVIGLFFVFLLKFSASRTTIYTAISVLLWVVLVRKRRFLVDNFLMRQIYIWFSPLMAVVSWGMYYLYIKGTKLGYYLNTLLTTRLNWSQRFMQEYGVSMWGTDIETVSTREAILTGVDKQILDMSYIRLPIEYGIIYTIFFLLASVLIARYLVKKKLWSELMLMIYFSAIGIGATTTINLFSNYMLLFLLPSLSMNFNREGKRIYSYQIEN